MLNQIMWILQTRIYTVEKENSEAENIFFQILSKVIFFSLTEVNTNEC